MRDGVTRAHSGLDVCNDKNLVFVSCALKFGSQMKSAFQIKSTVFDFIIEKN